MFAGEYVHAADLRANAAVFKLTGTNGLWHVGPEDRLRAPRL